MHVRNGSGSGVGKEGGQTDRRRGWCSSVATGGLGGRARGGRAVRYFCARPGTYARKGRSCGCRRRLDSWLRGRVRWHAGTNVQVTARGEEGW